MTSPFAICWEILFRSTVFIKFLHFLLTLIGLTELAYYVTLFSLSLVLLAHWDSFCYYVRPYEYHFHGPPSPPLIVHVEVPLLLSFGRHVFLIPVLVTL